MGYIRRSLLDNYYETLNNFKNFLGTLKCWEDYVIIEFVPENINNWLKGKHTKSYGSVNMPIVIFYIVLYCIVSYYTA